MKLCVKKIYCPNCHRLARGREQAVDGNIQVSCCKCSNPIWIWDGVTWRHVSKQAQ